MTKSNTIFNMYAIDTRTFTYEQGSEGMLKKLVLHSDLESGVVVLQESLPAGSDWKLENGIVVEMTPEEIQEKNAIAAKLASIQALNWAESFTERPLRIIVRQSDVEPPDGVLRELAILMILRGSPHFRCDALGRKDELGSFHSVYLKRLESEEMPDIQTYLTAMSAGVYTIANLPDTSTISGCSFIDLR